MPRADLDKALRKWREVPDTLRAWVIGALTGWTAFGLARERNEALRAAAALLRAAGRVK